MMLTNNDLRTEFAKTQFVVLVKRDGVNKYISKSYYNSRSFNFTVKINEAKKFDNIKTTQRFIDNNDVKNIVGIYKVENKLVLNEQIEM